MVRPTSAFLVFVEVRISDPIRLLDEIIENLILLLGEYETSVGHRVIAPHNCLYLLALAAATTNGNIVLTILSLGISKCRTLAALQRAGQSFCRIFGYDVGH